MTLGRYGRVGSTELRRNDMDGIEGGRRPVSNSTGVSPSCCWPYEAVG